MRSFKTIEFEKELKRPMKCPHCGQLLPKGKYLCEHCQGQSGKEKIKNSEKTKEIECPNCSSLNKIGAVTCKSCGINFVQYKMSQVSKNLEKEK